MVEPFFRETRAVQPRTVFDDAPCLKFSVDGYSERSGHAVDMSPPPWGRVRWGQQTTARQVWDFVGLSCKVWFGRKSNGDFVRHPVLMSESEKAFLQEGREQRGGDRLLRAQREWFFRVPSLNLDFAGNYTVRQAAGYRLFCRSSRALASCSCCSGVMTLSRSPSSTSARLYRVRLMRWSVTRLCG